MSEVFFPLKLLFPLVRKLLVKKLIQTGTRGKSFYVVLVTIICLHCSAHLEETLDSCTELVTIFY